MKVYGAFSCRKENEQYHLKLEKGEKIYLFLHFYNPVVIVLKGEEITVQKDACLIYTPDEPQEYYALPGGFTNDYVKFIPDKDFIAKYNLPLNEIFYISNPFGVTPYISFITWALTDVLFDHQAEINDALKNILQILSDSLHKQTPMEKRARANKSRLITLRERVMENPGEWTVDRMANEFCLTRSHFCIVYNNAYGISPGKDLLKMRLECATRLLLETDQSINDISNICGYKNSENFIRSYKKYYSISPLQYRKKYKL